MNFPPQNPTLARRRAFTILELLAVLTVIAIFFAMTAPHMTGMMGSGRLNSSGDFLYNKIAQAQQLAINENREVLVRFFEYESADARSDRKEFRAIQIAGRTPDGSIEPLSDVLPLRPGTIISRDPNLSPLVADSAVASGTNTIPQSDSEAAFSGFTIYADGSTSLPAIRSGPDNSWFLTVIEEKPLPDADTPKNFYCLQIDPLTGRLSAFRP
ncbi:MAG: Verru_Chthon cassette protein D [Verrucomicrobiota bacterium]